ncbi:MAG: DUF2155 domain-containing protein [Planktomarina sp.]
MSLAQRASEGAAAQLRWLDRTTGDLQDYVLAVGETQQMGPLSVTLHGCRYPEGQISRDAFAHLQINDHLRSDADFAGWMVASSPGLNALQHPRYDVWVIRCRTAP